MITDTDIDSGYYRVSLSSFCSWLASNNCRSTGITLPADYKKHSIGYAGFQNQTYCVTQF